MLKCWTDGAAMPNPGRGAAACVANLGDIQPTPEIPLVYERTVALGDNVSNNVAELAGIELAVDLALELLAKNIVLRQVSITTDSQYAAGVIGKGWKAKANVAMVGQIRQKCKRLCDPTRQLPCTLALGWERRDFSPENKRVDQLAKELAQIQ